ncbi:MAG: LuxR C-terminal-related transcriptional regulator [Candidatus Zixiibacteriota bacterium]
MGKRKEHEFAELPVDKLILESFANTQSAYHIGDSEPSAPELSQRFRQKLRWHIGHSLSERQQQVIRAFLAGRKERDTARDLGITQQVVNIYKQRAIKKLHKLLTS